MVDFPIEQLDPNQAFDYLQQNADAVLLDVRSSVEYTHVGHPQGALHVAWSEGPGWQRNEDFVTQVREALAQRGVDAPDTTPILAICRSGQRSQAACEALAGAGFRTLMNVQEGFEGDLDAHRHRNTINGWRARGLPWEQT